MATSVEDQEILNWLNDSETTKPVESVESGFDEEKALQWLSDGKDVEEQQVQPKPVIKESKPVTEYFGAASDELLNLVDLPNHLYNWAADNLNQYRMPDDESPAVARTRNIRVPTVGDMAAESGVGYKEGEEPDTAAYRAGKFTIMGLEFMAPFLQIAKVPKGLQAPANALKSAPVGIRAEAPTMIGGVKTGVKPVPFQGGARGVVEQLNKPYLNTPKRAIAIDLLGGGLSGVGSYYGEEKFGTVGGQIGGLGLGIVPAITITNAGKIADATMRTVFPFTQKGGMARASQIVDDLKQIPNVSEQIKLELQRSLKGTKHTTAQLSGDDYISALEKVLIDADPALAFEIKQQNLSNNAVAKFALEKMAGKEGVSEIAKSLQSRTLKLKTYLNAKVDHSINKVKDAITGMKPKQMRIAANTAIKNDIDKALKAARKDETITWNKVNKRNASPTQETLKEYKTLASDRWAEDDPTEIPKYLEGFLGRYDNKGKWIFGSYDKKPQMVGNLHALRRRVQKDATIESSLEAPDWNKVRILGQLDDALLRDLERSESSDALTEAISVSRELNSKFKGGIMSTIMRNYKTGGSLDTSMTMDSLALGEKGAVQIKKILTASPESHGSIEDILKLNMVKSKIIKDNTIDDIPRLNLPKAKSYMAENQSVMEMFPTLSKQMDEAIAFEERVTYFTKDAIKKIAKVDKSLAGRLSATKPKRILATIMDEQEPEKAIVRVYRHLNEKGKVALKNDIFDYIKKNSLDSKINLPDGTRSLSGKRAESAWAENKKVFSKIYKKDEIERIEKIVHTLKTGDTQTNLPVSAAEKALATKTNLLSYAVETYAVRMGAKLGHGTSGASLRTASTAGNMVKRFMDKIGSNTATKLLKNAVQDKELFKAIEDFPMRPPTKEKFFDKEHLKSITIIKGWMIANAIESAEETD